MLPQQRVQTLELEFYLEDPSGRKKKRLVPFFEKVHRHKALAIAGLNRSKMAHCSQAYARSLRRFTDVASLYSFPRDRMGVEASKKEVAS